VERGVFLGLEADLLRDPPGRQVGRVNNGRDFLLMTEFPGGRG
jgi:hypothetical protein